MFNRKISALESEAAKVRSTIQDFETVAESESRDFSIEETAQVDALINRAGEITAELNELATKQDKIDAVEAAAAKVRSSIVIPTSSKIEVPTASEYLAGLYQQVTGRGDGGAKFRTIEQIGLADVPSLVPEPVLSPVINRYDASRPVWSVFNGQGAVEAKTMIQAFVVDHVDVDIQVNEFDEVASNALTTDERSITAVTFAGAVEISAQARDWTSPSAWNLTVEDFAKVYARRTEAFACAKIAAAATENVAFSMTSVEAFIESIEGARVALEDNLDEVNDLVIFLSPSEWAKWQAFTNTNDERVLTALNGYPLPRIVRARRFTNPNASYIADASGLRSWETIKGLAELFRVSYLKWELGYHAYAALDVEPGSVLDLSYAGS